MLPAVLLALRTCWVFLSHCLHYTGQPEHKKPGLKGNQSLWGWHKFCAGPRVMRSARTLGNYGNEPWSKLAAPLGLSGHLLIPTAATGLSNGIPRVPGRGTARYPLGRSVWLSLLPGPAQKGSGGVVGISGCALSPLQSPFHLQPLTEQAAHGAQTLLLTRICG